MVDSVAGSPPGPPGMSEPAGFTAPEPLFRPHDVRSLRDRAYDDIRDAILTGALNPGQRIKERDVAAEMGISTTPVKEALRRLEQEGLVVSQPRRGAVVGPLVLTPDSEILELRADLEGLAARLAAHKMTVAEKEALRTQLVETERPAAGGDAIQPELVVDATLEFHRLIHEGSKNPFLIRFLAMVEAIARGDGDEAERVMHEHVYRVIDLAGE